jgi:hypothetical protein
MKYSIVCSVSNETTLRNNLLLSPDISKHNLLLQYNYTNLSKAYNDAKPSEDIVIYVHQDVYLPGGFFNQLTTSILQLTVSNCNWGVIGPAGRSSRGWFGSIVDRGKNWGNSELLPKEVDTLDELMLVTKNNEFIFDEGILNHHLFGADLCMQAREAGKLNYAINAYCHHNSSSSYELPKEFEVSKQYIKQKWNKYLPIYTTCTVIMED